METYNVSAFLLNFVLDDLPFPKRFSFEQLAHKKNTDHLKFVFYFFKTTIFFDMLYLPYDTNLKEFSRQLRNNSTLGEILLWKKLRAGSLMYNQFNRQKPLDRYIVDFYYKPLSLVIEIDGSYHNQPEQRVKD